MPLKNEELNRLHDDELLARGGDEPGIDRDHLEDEDRVRLAALDEIGAVVRHTLLAESESVDVWAAVARRLPARPAQLSVMQRLRRWLREHRLMMMVPALAAATALLVWLGTGRVSITHACDIEELDVSGAAATVMHVDHDGKGTGTVIWMTEEE